MANKKTIILISIFSIALLTLFYFSISQTMIGAIHGIKDSPITKTVTWNNIPVTINSLYLGSITAGQEGNSICINSQNGVCKEYSSVSFCGLTGRGSSSGSYLSNSYDIDSTRLKLSSTIGGANGCSNNKNYIKTTMKLPKGKLTLIYTLHSKSTYRDSGNSIANIVINGKSINLRCSDQRSDGGRLANGKPGNACSIYGGSTGGATKTGMYTLDLTKNSNVVNLDLYTQKSYHGSSSASVSLAFIKTSIIKPTTPEHPQLKSIINSIFTWIQKVWSNIFNIKQSMTGSTNTYTSNNYKYKINITTTKPDNNYKDGTYSVEYANWGLIDSSGNIIKQGNWEIVDGNYNKELTLQTPSTEGNFALVSMITETKMKFNDSTNKWADTKPIIKVKEAINIKNRNRITTPNNPIAPQFKSFISNIMNWLKDFWSNLF